MKINKLIRKTSPLILLLLLFSCSSLQSETDRLFLNTDFEYGVYNAQPRKWSVEGEGSYTAYLDSTASKSGRKSLYMELDNAETYTFVSLPGNLVAGKTVSLNAHIYGLQADSLQNRLIYFDPETGSVLASSEIQAGTGRWQAVSLEAALPADYASGTVLLAIHSSGTGSFRFDAVRISIDGEVTGDGAPDFREPTQDEIERLDELAIPFSVSDSKVNAGEPEPLSSIVGDSRIVALGENSHGSSTIYKLKLRILKQLVEEEGFTVFALEMPAVEADYINDYVLHGRGTTDEVIRKLSYPSWQTREMAEIIEWIKNYNENNGARIEFRGFDMQYGQTALNKLKEFASRYDAPLLRELEEIGESIAGLRKRPRLAVSIDTAIGAARDRLHTHDYIEPDSKTVSDMRRYMEVFRQNFRWRHLPDSAKSRDVYMAENISRLLEQGGPEAKIIISGDNTHITEAGSKTGARLAERYGGDYLSIGFTFGTGTYAAYGPKESYEVHPPYAGTYEYFFSKSRHANYIVDLRDAGGIPILNQAEGFRSIGSRPQESTQFYEIDIREHFDAVIYLTESQHTLRLDN